MDSHDDETQMARVPHQLRGVFRQVAIRAAQKFEEALMAENLLDENGDAVSPATNESLEIATKALGSGLLLVFSMADLRIPATCSIDEIELGNSMTETFGNARVSVFPDANRLSVEFDGKAPMVKSIRAPLDLQLALDTAGHDNVVNVQLGRKPIITGSGFIDDDLIALNLRHLRSRNSRS